MAEEKPQKEKPQRVTEGQRPTAAPVDRVRLDAPKELPPDRPKPEPFSGDRPTPSPIDRLPPPEPAKPPDDKPVQPDEDK